MLSVMSAASQIKPAKFAGCFRSVWRFGGSDNRPEITTFQVFQRLFSQRSISLLTGCQLKGDKPVTSAGHGVN